MKRSLQEYVELVVFGLIALLVGTGLLWVVGWVFSLGGIVLKGLAGLLWMLLRFIVPVAIAGGLVYFIVKAAQGRSRTQASATGGSSSSRTVSEPTYAPPPPADAATGAPVATEAVVDVPNPTGGVTQGDVALGSGPAVTDPEQAEVVQPVDDVVTDFDEGLDDSSDLAADETIDDDTALEDDERQDV